MRSIMHRTKVGQGSLEPNCRAVARACPRAAWMQTLRDFSRVVSPCSALGRRLVRPAGLTARPAPANRRRRPVIACRPRVGCATGEYLPRPWWDRARAHALTRRRGRYGEARPARLQRTMREDVPNGAAALLDAFTGSVRDSTNATHLHSRIGLYVATQGSTTGRIVPRFRRRRRRPRRGDTRECAFGALDASRRGTPSHAKSRQGIIPHCVPSGPALARAQDAAGAALHGPFDGRAGVHAID
jgi:hypothetical protein